MPSFPEFLKKWKDLNGDVNILGVTFSDPIALFAFLSMVKDKESQSALLKTVFGSDD